MPKTKILIKSQLLYSFFEKILWQNLFVRVYFLTDKNLILKVNINKIL